MGGDVRSGVTSAEAVACAPSGSLARTVMRTGMSAQASGRTSMVTGTVTVAPGARLTLVSIEMHGPRVVAGHRVE